MRNEKEQKMLISFRMVPKNALEGSSLTRGRTVSKIFQHAGNPEHMRNHLLRLKPVPDCSFIFSVNTDILSCLHSLA